MGFFQNSGTANETNDHRGYSQKKGETVHDQKGLLVNHYFG